MNATGEDARKFMHDILAQSPKAVMLADEVVAFYGSWLELNASPKASYSSFCVSHRPKQTYVEITLKMGTGREPEALTHELLHAHLLTQGFPWYEPLSMNAMRGWNIRKPAPQLVNCIHHELMFDGFLSFGFTADRFLDRREDDPPDFEKDARAEKPVAFGRWCYNFYHNWQSWRFAEIGDVWKETYRRRADDVLLHGMKVFHDLPKVRDLIERWFDEDGFRHPYDDFAIAFDKLARIMRLPIIGSAWYVLEPPTSHPTAVYLWPL